MGNKWHTELYINSMDRNMLLRFDSSHPRSMIKSLPYSQMLRVKGVIDVKVNATLEQMAKNKEDIHTN